MSPKDFFEKLSNNCPSAEELAKAGLNKDTILSLQEMWCATLQKNINRSPHFTSHFSVNDLANYDLSTIQIESFTFLPELKENQDYILFGTDAENFVAINKVTLEIVRVDYYSGELTENYAASFEHFLEVLLLIAQYSKKGYLGQPYTESDRRTHLLQCIEAAGGNRYRDYYDTAYN